MVTYTVIAAQFKRGESVEELAHGLLLYKCAAGNGRYWSDQQFNEMRRYVEHAIREVLKRQPRRPYGR